MEALSAFGGGLYGIAGAAGVPILWLRGSPFSDYLVPSLALFVIVGGALLVGALAVLLDRRAASRWASAAAAILLGWIALEVAVIGYTSWLQPFTVAVALVLLVLAFRLGRDERIGRRPDR